MQDFSKIIQNIIDDIAVEFTEEYAENFRRKAFFNTAWTRSQSPNKNGSLMMRSGALRSSIRNKKSANSIMFSSRLPYSTIHNDGGEITVSRKMKRFFWAMYYKHSGNVKSLKRGGMSKSKSSMYADESAQFYKAMALKKVGSKIKIPQRQFIGDHPKAREIIESIITEEINNFFNNPNNLFKNANKHI